MNTFEVRCITDPAFTDILFKDKKTVEKAIKILGDKIKYLKQ